MTDPAADVRSPQEPVDLQVESGTSTGGGPAEVHLLDLARAKLVLTRLLRVAYPHGSFPDGPYDRTAETILAALEADDGDRRTLFLGLGGLDIAAGGDFVSADDQKCEVLLRNVGDDVFFVRIRSTAVVALYDDAEVWEALGYEGSAFEQGGYLDRGFDDLDWLPPARIEEYADAPRVEIATQEGTLR